MKKILIIVALIIVLIVGYILSSKFRNNPISDCPEPTCLAPVATTTSVVETGATTTKNFYDKNLGVGFSYPDNFYINENLTDYISPVEWPPQITVDGGKYVCKTSGNKILPDGKTETTCNSNS